MVIFLLCLKRVASWFHTGSNFIQCEHLRQIIIVFNISPIVEIIKNSLQSQTIINFYLPGGIKVHKCIMFFYFIFKVTPGK